MVPDSAERIYDEVTDLVHLTQQMEGWVGSVKAAKLINIHEHWSCFSFAVIMFELQWDYF